MNIVFLLNSTYPYYTGGRETWINNICNRLCETHNIFIITEEKNNNNEDDGVFTNIDPRIHIIPTNNLKTNQFLCPLFRSYFNWIYQELTAENMRRELKKLLKTLQIKNTVIISMDTVFMGKIGRWAKLNYPEIKYISSVRGPHAEITGKYYPLLKQYLMNCERKNLSFADKIWANGWDTQTKLKEKGFDAVVIKNGLDANRINCIDKHLIKMPMSEHINLIAIGSLLDIKGYPELINAISILKSQYNVLVNVVVLGKGNAKEYKKLAKSLDIVNLIHFMGEHRETVECASQFDIAACLSGGSGLSMACLESMLSKTPVVAWDSPIYRQMMVHKESGYLVRENDAGELAKGIYWIISHKSEAKIIGEHANKIAEKFDWNYIVSDINKELEGEV